MKSTLCIAAACLLGAVASTAHAQNTYFEVSYQSVDLGAQSNAGAVRAIVGFKSNEMLDLEAMMGFGVKDAKINDEVFGVSVNGTAKVDRMLGVYVRPKFKLDNNIEFYGRLGIAITQITAEASGQLGNSYAYSEETDSESSLSYGVGASYAITPALAITTDFMRLNDDADAYSVGVRYSF